MNEIEIGVLEACQEYATRQQEMLPHLAAALGLEPAQVFYAWMSRRCAQRGTLAQGDWGYFFHGWECDLRNQKDGRFLRMDFGPKGRVGILNEGGVLRLIMTSIPPWKAFSSLRSYFAGSDAPCDQSSGGSEKMWQVWGRLDRQGFFEQADSNLVKLQAKYTTRGPDGLNYLEFPPEVAEEIRADCKVAHRLQLSERALEFLRMHITGQVARAESPAESALQTW